MVNQLAVVLGPDLGAAVPFYGARRRPPTSPRSRRRSAPSSASSIRASPAPGPTSTQALTQMGIPHEGYIYANANHGFHNDTTPRYDEAAAKLAWGHTMDWFTKYLR